MKHSQAEVFIRNALWCVQKVRSIGNEQAQDDPILHKVQMFLEPKIYDDRWMLSPLLKLVERMDNGGKITPLEFFNMMVIIDKWGQTIDVEYILATENLEGFPAPDIQWCHGWESENISSPPPLQK